MSAQPAVLELSNVHKRLGTADVIRGVSLSVQRGERVALIGPNGAGKSTLFNLISGMAAPDLGHIWLMGQRIDGRTPHAINRLGLSRSFQITNIFPQLSVFDNLRCSALWSLGYGYALFRLLSGLKDANARAEELMCRIGLEGRRDTVAAELSYAEQRALELGITIAGGAGVILLDEPTAGMSQSESQRSVALIRDMTDGKTLLMVEHDMGVVFGLADKVAVLAQGEVIAFDTPAAVRANPRVQAAYLGQGVP
jgi:branched-chain amino acid transport system ATP-binding protein